MAPDSTASSSVCIAGDGVWWTMSSRATVPASHPCHGDGDQNDAMSVDLAQEERVRSGSDTRRFARRLAVVAVLGLVARIAYVLVIGRHLTLGFDAIWYELQAGTVASGKGYVDPDSYYRLGHLVPTANFPPLWPIVLAVANRLGIDTRDRLPDGGRPARDGAPSCSPASWGGGCRGLGSAWPPR